MGLLRNQKPIITIVIMGAFFLFPMAAESKSTAKPRNTVSRSTSRATQRGVASGPSRQPSARFAGSAGPLKIHGQTRNLSMMLVLKGEKDKIKFGEIRQDFRNEIPKTSF